MLNTNYYVNDHIRLNPNQVNLATMTRAVNPSVTTEPEFNWIPKIEKEFDSVEEAYEFWNTYGRRIGFSCRHQYSHTSKKDKTCTSARFVCAKEGIRKIDKRDKLVKNPRAETRVNCLARMGVTKDRKNGKYKIHDLILEHTHEVHLPATTYLMPSQRKISNLDAHEIDLADASGIRPRESTELRGRRVGGVANLGYTRLDQKNYLRTKRQRELEYGEAGSIMRYFQQKSQENPSFYFDMQFDNEEQITNIFWADARMLLDYAFFGDVITFDTTFGTNKEYRPFGVFAGFNHHRKLVIFGAALLYDETKASFEWLFKTFLEAHKQKKPKTIFTDQDNAMGKAIGEVMPDVYHGLCTFHIMQNAVKHLGNQLKTEGCILKDLKGCMYEYEEEGQFKDAWDELVCKYNMQNNSWLDSIYQLKEKWAKCYMKRIFNIGMRSTQLSESFNKDLKSYLKYNLDINRFFQQFERVVEAKRNKDLKEEYACREKLPQIRLKNSPFVLQVCRVYTPYIFEQFQDEVDKASTIFVKQQNENDSSKIYVVGSISKDEEYTVTLTIGDENVSCTCRKYETIGILCQHALRILDICDIKRIPDRYILQRWTIQAKKGVVPDNQGRNMQEDVNIAASERYKIICPKLVQLAIRCSENHQAWCHVEKNIEKLFKEVYMMCEEDVRHKDRVSMLNASDCSAKQGCVEYKGHLIKGLKKKTGRKGGKRLRSWNEKIKGKQRKVVAGNMSSNHPASCMLNEGYEVPSDLTWMSYQYDDEVATLSHLMTDETSFTKLLTGNKPSTHFPLFSTACNEQVSTQNETHNQTDTNNNLKPLGREESLDNTTTYFDSSF